MTEDQKKAIRDEATRRGISVAEVLQEVLRQKPEQRKSELPDNYYSPFRQRNYGEDH